MPILPVISKMISVYLLADMVVVVYKIKSKVLDSGETQKAKILVIFSLIHEASISLITQSASKKRG